MSRSNGTGQPQSVSMDAGEGIGASGGVELVDVDDRSAGVGLDPPEMPDPGLCVEERLALPVAGPGVLSDDFNRQLDVLREVEGLVQAFVSLGADDNDVRFGALILVEDDGHPAAHEEMVGGCAVQHGMEQHQDPAVDVGLRGEEDQAAVDQFRVVGQSWEVIEILGLEPLRGGMTQDGRQSTSSSAVVIAQRQRADTVRAQMFTSSYRVGGIRSHDAIAGVRRA